MVLALIVAYLAFAIIWANGEASHAVCKSLDVRILNADSTVFITQKLILSELEEQHLNPIGKPFSKINTEVIEKALDKFDYLEEAECVIEDNSRIIIEVKQFIPVMRVFDGGKSYYLNKDGKQMIANGHYHIDVPVVQGTFNYKFKATSLIPLTQYILKNEALNTFVTMIVARDSNNVYIVPNVYGHVINMGAPKDLDSKFEKLKLMYSEVMPVMGWYTYDTISVKWDYQIVATRRQKAIKEEMIYDANDDEPAPDIETMTIDEVKTSELQAKSPPEKDYIKNVEKEKKQVSEKKEKPDSRENVKQKSKSKPKEKPKEEKKENSADNKNKHKQSADNVTKKAFGNNKKGSNNENSKK